MFRGLGGGQGFVTNPRPYVELTCHVAIPLPPHDIGKLLLLLPTVLSRTMLLGSMLW